MIADDMRLSQHLDALIRSHSEFEAFTQHLSITTFRYVPSELKPQIGSPAVEKHIDEINQALLSRVAVQRRCQWRIRAASLHRELPHLACRHRSNSAVALAPRRGYLP
jgi:hypothetical protein